MTIAQTQIPEIGEVSAVRRKFRKESRAKPLDGFRLPDITQLLFKKGEKLADSFEGADLPDHTQLPCEDNDFVRNFQEHPQSILITDSFLPLLERRHPDNRFIIGQDSGIYWRLAEKDEKPQKGAICPDWFYVAGVPRLLDGQMRRSYVMWKEHVTPFLVMEFVSGNGSEERDKTPKHGKFWIYEQMIRVPYYAIYEVKTESVELWQLKGSRYKLVPTNDRDHYPIPSLGVELGIWQGVYQGTELPWMRLWDAQGNLLLTGHELAEQERQQTEQERQRTEQEHQRVEQERQRAEQERQRAEHLASQLRALGVEPA